MESGDRGENTKFAVSESPYETGFSCVPRLYEIPSSYSLHLTSKTAEMVVIDLAGLDDPFQRPVIVEKIGNACRESRFFQIINHGISQKVLDEALGAAFGFFDLPTTEKTTYMSNDFYKPVRYEIQSQREFLKHYAHPLDEYIQQWPQNPPEYRQKMGDYAKQTRHLVIKIMGVITESLGLGSGYLEKKIEDGMQVMAVNYYPKCPEPHMALGVAAHSDHSCITVVLCSSSGLEIMDASDDTWRSVPELHGALQVHVGDHMEVLSNGLYKSLLHRVILNKERTRASIASFHSMGLDEKMATAEELITDENPKKYKESSFRDFLDFLTSGDIAKGKTFIESLKIN